MLLRQLKWNKDTLVEKFMDNANAMLVASGAIAPEIAPSPPSSRAQSLRSQARGSKSKAKSPPQKKSPATDEPFVCQICFNDAPGQHTLALACDHVYCAECWTEHVVAKIRDESEHSVHCMAEGCALVAPDTFLRGLLLNLPGADAERVDLGKKMWARLQELFVRHFVACQASLKFCPYPSCTNTVSCPSAATRASLITVVPTVSCGARGIGNADGKASSSSSQTAAAGSLQSKEHKFCFGCTVDGDHRPVVCGAAKLWLKKCRDDSETANWIKSNTKECSKCQSTIEKNGGCKYVSLSSNLCRRTTEC